MKEVIAAFDKFLTKRALSFEAILIGGAVLNILDISSRKTKDVDCLNSGREDFLKSKLYAYCDRTTPDFEDLKDLKPTEEELNDALDWVKQRDAHANWPSHVEKSFNVLKKALGYV